MRSVPDPRPRLPLFTLDPSRSIRARSFPRTLPTLPETSDKPISATRSLVRDPLRRTAISDPFRLVRSSVTAGIPWPHESVSPPEEVLLAAVRPGDLLDEAPAEAAAARPDEVPAVLLAAAAGGLPAVRPEVLRDETPADTATPRPLDARMPIRSSLRACPELWRTSIPAFPTRT